MPLKRKLEPEIMDSAQEAADYDAMDHREVNQRFVEDLLKKVQDSWFGVQDFEADEDGDDPHLDILDLGTGTALIPIELCKRLSHCRVIAADAAPSMLELARYNVEVNGLIHRIELAQVDAKGLPFADEMFDVVMSNSIIHHIPEPIAVLCQSVRVARRGGMLFFRDMLRPNSEAELQQLVTTYTGNANDHQQRMFAESLHAALSLDEIRELVAALGFNRDTVQQTSDRHWTWAAVKTGTQPSWAQDVAGRLVFSFFPLLFGVMFGFGTLALFVSDIPPLGFWGTTILIVTQELLLTATLAMLLLLLLTRCWLAPQWLDTAVEFALSKLCWVIGISAATIAAFAICAALWRAKLE